MFPPADNDFDSGDDFGGDSQSRALATDRRPANALSPVYPGELSTMPWPYGMPTRPEILSATPTLGSLLPALRRRIWLGLFLGLLLGGGLAALAWYLLPTKFESTAVLAVAVQNPDVWHKDATGVDFLTYKQVAQNRMRKDPQVLNKALADRSVQDLDLVKRNSQDALNWLSENLDVIYPNPNGDIMTVTLRAEQKEGVPEIVNAVVDSFVKEVVDQERNVKLLKRDSLERKYQKYKRDMMDKQRQLFELNQQIGSTDARGQKARYQLELDNLDTLRRRRAKLQDDISDLTLKFEKAQLLRDNADKFSVPEERLEEVISRDPQIQEAMKELSLLRKEQRELERTLRRKDSPELVRIHEAINTAEQNIQELKGVARQMLIEQIRAGADKDGPNMKSMELERKLLAAELQKTISDIDQQADNVQKLERFNGDAEQLRAEIDQLAMVIKDMSSTLFNWTVELDAGPRITVREKAGPAVAQAPWRQYAVAGFAGLLGFGLALGSVTFFEFLSRRLNSSHDVASGLGIRVMGDLPSLRQRGLIRGRSRQALHGLVAESINSIRATLMQNSEIGQSKVFLVTSAGEQEGKTTVASQLAASLGRAGRRTLLIDGDMRHPGAHHVFGLDNDQGLAELLRGEATLDDVIRPTPADGLWMLTAGRACGMAVMALGKDVTARVVDQLRDRFEFIVIDTGPVLGVADPLLIGSHVDGAILSVLRDVSKIQKVYDAYERLKLAGVNVVGAVVNGAAEHGSFDRYHFQAPAA